MTLWAARSLAALVLIPVALAWFQLWWFVLGFFVVVAIAVLMFGGSKDDDDDKITAAYRKAEAFVKDCLTWLFRIGLSVFAAAATYHLMQTSSNTPDIERVWRQAGSAIGTAFNSERNGLVPKSLPPWMEQLRKNPIVPGVGMAGVSVGQHESAILAKLGDPSSTEFITDRGNTSTLRTYKWNDIGLKFSTVNGTLQSIGLHGNQNRGKDVLPTTDRGITIGSKQSDLVLAYGPPHNTYDRFACSENEPAKMLEYNGTNYWHCLQSGRIGYITVFRR